MFFVHFRHLDFDFNANPQLDEIYQEQLERFPKGLLGTLVPMGVELMADIPSEGVSLLNDCLDGKLDLMNLMTFLESLRIRLDTKPEGLGL